LQVRSGNTADGPRTYTVEAGKSLSDTWSVDAQGRYDLSVYGPNGFMRAFKGAVSQPAKANLDAMVKNKTVLQERKEQVSSALQGADSKPKDPQAAYNAARVYARLGDADQALTWLNKALDLGYDQFDYLSLDPSLVNLKKDPRFLKLLEERRPAR